MKKKKISILQTLLIAGGVLSNYSNAFAEDV
jgi:hypothetical protein